MGRGGGLFCRVRVSVVTVVGPVVAYCELTVLIPPLFFLPSVDSLDKKSKPLEQKSLKTSTGFFVKYEFTKPLID